MDTQDCPLTPSKNVPSHANTPLKQSAQVEPSAQNLKNDPFDMVEEYIGVDDEYMYIVEPFSPVLAASVEQGNNIQEKEDDGVDVFVHHKEEEVVIIDPAGYTVVHDIDNPDMRVGALFPDIVTFRKAIRQRAILVGFKLAKIKKDKTRFIAECAHGPCPWRIHASTLQDGRTVMVWLSTMLLFILCSYFLLHLIYVVLVLFADKNASI
uniref:Transposase MuDR plant domain-containing protein n=1 Tax=Triticum urartu TaxID=4572 RepID=A0A8R7UI76_TRIUA